MFGTCCRLYTRVDTVVYVNISYIRVASCSPFFGIVCPPSAAVASCDNSSTKIQYLLQSLLSGPLQPPRWQRLVCDHARYVSCCRRYLLRRHTKSYPGAAFTNSIKQYRYILLYLVRSECCLQVYSFTPVLSCGFHYRKIKFRSNRLAVKLKTEPPSVPAQLTPVGLWKPRQVLHSSSGGGVKLGARQRPSCVAAELPPPPYYAHYPAYAYLSLPFVFGSGIPHQSCEL